MTDEIIFSKKTIYKRKVKSRVGKWENERIKIPQSNKRRGTAVKKLVITKFFFLRLLYLSTTLERILF